MKKYTILSFCFNGYDNIREPLILDPAAEYIYITDHKVESKSWKVIIDPKLVNKNPIYSSYYVRYHPFEYVNTDIVFIVDSSIQIKDSLNPIYEEFKNSGADYSPIITNYYNDENKIKFWKTNRNFNDVEQIEKINTFIKYMCQENYKGSIGEAFIMTKNTPITKRFQKHVWRYLLALGNYGVPNRLDEIVGHKVLRLYLKKLKLFIISIQIIQSTYMDYCTHNSDLTIPPYNNYDQYYYLCNIPVYPIRFDKAINFPRQYKYKTEAILLTKYLNENDLIEWLDWHLNTCKFEHIQVFDNESNYDVKSICDRYENVSYELVKGQARQYKIYNDYFKKSKAEWIMPIDDDEYLQISNEFDSIYDAIIYYRKKFTHLDMLAVRWKHLFPKKFHTERTGKVLEYCTEENPELAKTFMHLGDSSIKTIVRNYGFIHYEETVENPAGGHIPKNSVFYGALTCDGKNVLGCGIPDCPKELKDEKIRLLHCRYKGYTDYTTKMKTAVTVSNNEPKKKHWKFDDLLESLE